MTFATKYRDLAHARIYVDWFELPAWLQLSSTAAKLLAAMLVEYRPGINGKTVWSAERAGYAVNRSKATGARLLLELTDKGWIDIVRVRQRGKRAPPSIYALSMWPNDATNEPATNAFRHWVFYPVSKATALKNKTICLKNENPTSQK
jgi:hypothetical protein